MRPGSALLPALVLLVATALPAAAGSAEEIAASLQSIEKLRGSGDVAGAAKEAGDLVAKHPDSLEVHIAHQDLQLALGRDKEVLDAYREAVKPADASADAHYLCARLLRGPTAVGEFRAALKADPHHFWAMCGLGTELTRARNYAEARTVLEGAAAERQASAIPVNALGRLEEARGKSIEAEKLYGRAIQMDPSMTVARVNLGVLQAALGRKTDAVKTLEDAATRAPKDPMPLLGLGMVYVGAKDLTSAVAAYRRAAALGSDDVTALNLLATAYLDLDQLDLADDVLQGALKKAPRNVSTNVHLSYVRTLQVRYDEAAKFAIQAIQLDDSCAEAHYMLGLVFDHQVQPKKAEVEFRRAQKLDDENPVFVRALAALAAGSGEWRTAIAEYTKVVKMTGGSGDALMELAAAYSGGKQPKSAASTYEQVVAAEPGRLPAWLQLGIVCARDLKENKRSIRAFKEYQKRGGNDPRVPGWIVTLEGEK